MAAGAGDTRLMDTVGNTAVAAEPTKLFGVGRGENAKIIEQFAQAVVATDGQWSAAYRMIHDCSNMKPHSVWNQAHALSKLPGVKERVRELLDEAAQRTIVTAAQLLARQYEIATADPSKIVWVSEHPCRRCYGIDNQYQWRDQDEYSEACAAELDRAAAKLDVPKLPSDAGGYGFTAHHSAGPNPECEHCKGVGEPAVHVRATRELEGKEAKLVKAIEQDRFGRITVKLHDQQKALDAIARIIGANKDELMLTKPSDAAEIPADVPDEKVADAYLSMVR